MSTERGFQSDALGQQARDFISWSRDTGAALSRMYRKSLPKALEIAQTQQDINSLPQGDIQILHQRDWIHHPGVLIARKRSQTFIQNLPPLISSVKERYAHITQIGKNDAAIGLSITRTLPLIPDGIVITFGRHSSYPNYEGIHGMGLIHISVTGETHCLMPVRMPKYQLTEQVSGIIKNMTRGFTVTDNPFIRTMNRIGEQKWSANKTF